MKELGTISDALELYKPLLSQVISGSNNKKDAIQMHQLVTNLKNANLHVPMSVMKSIVSNNLGAVKRSEDVPRLQRLLTLREWIEGPAEKTSSPTSDFSIEGGSSGKEVKEGKEGNKFSSSSQSDMSTRAPTGTSIDDDAAECGVNFLRTGGLPPKDCAFFVARHLLNTARALMREPAAADSDRLLFLFFCCCCGCGCCSGSVC